jgi:hypothetical protein
MLKDNLYILDYFKTYLDVRLIYLNGGDINSTHKLKIKCIFFFQIKAFI